MRRREIVAFLTAGATYLVRTPVGAQSRPTPYRVAFVANAGPLAQITESDHPFFRAFIGELRKRGYVEGRTLILERYSGEGRLETFAEVARSVVETRPDVIVAITDAMVRAFAAATATIPLVVVCSDPVAQRFAGSLARPGGNITGIAVYAGPEILEKYFEILKEIHPRISRVGLLAPRTTWELSYGAALKNSAERLGVSLLGPPLEGRVDEQEYRRVVSEMVRGGVEALVADLAPTNFVYAKVISELASSHRLPALSAYPEHARLGGLVSYATDLEDQYRHLANQVDRILRGEHPGDLPFHRPTRLRLLLNLKAAAALGITVTPSLLIRADEVIE